MEPEVETSAPSGGGHSGALHPGLGLDEDDESGAVKSESGGLPTALGSLLCTTSLGRAAPGDGSHHTVCSAVTSMTTFHENRSLMGVFGGSVGI